MQEERTMPNHTEYRVVNQGSREVIDSGLLTAAEAESAAREAEKHDSQPVVDIEVMIDDEWFSYNPRIHS